MVNATQFYCTCNTDAAAASGLRVGQPVEIELEDQAVETNRIGQISFISPVVDPASGLQEIKAIFANQDGAVHPGVAGAIRTLPPSLTE